jgi:DsbC/DsbD-like thiol-disulfide interchange protein
MMNRPIALIRASMLAAATAAAPAAALAAASDWHLSDGGAVRVVVASQPEADGALRAALEIDLKPGWKTYWLDPGASGVPPTVDVSSGAAAWGVAVDMPAPQRLSDGYSSFAGYAAPVAAALTIRPPAGWDGGPLDISVFIGICETICVPVQAQFSIDAGAESTADDEAVAAAFGSLPAAAEASFGISSAWVDGDELVVDAAVPGNGAEAELFIASTPSFLFGEPRLEAGSRRFRVPLLDRPAGASPKAETARYTLVGDGKAVSGTIAITGQP